MAPLARRQAATRHNDRRSLNNTAPTIPEGVQPYSFLDIVLCFGVLDILGHEIVPVIRRRSVGQ